MPDADPAMSVSVTADSLQELQELQGYWEAQAVDAAVVEPLAASVWSAGLGMLTDRFGVIWSVSVSVTAQPDPRGAS